MNITLNININVKVLIVIIFIIIIAFILIYKKQENFLVGNEAVENISRVYADTIGTANFNKINTNDIKVNNILDISGKLITRNLDVSGKITAYSMDISGERVNIDQFGNNLMWANEININKKLLFSTDKTNNKWEGIHIFWMQSGWNTHQKKYIINPNGEYYNADKWVCVLSINYDYQDHHGLRTYVDTVTNNWCIYKWLDLAKAASVTVMCYPRQMFSKVWAMKMPHSDVDAFGPSGAGWNDVI